MGGEREEGEKMPSIMVTPSAKRRSDQFKIFFNIHRTRCKLEFAARRQNWWNFNLFIFFFSYLSKFYIVLRGNIQNISTKKNYWRPFLRIISFTWDIPIFFFRISINVINFGTFYFRPLFGAFLVVFGICWRKQTSSKIRFYLLGNNPSFWFCLFYWLFYPIWNSS